MAVALGAVSSILGFSLLGPFVAKSAADDAGIFAFLFGQMRAPAPRYQPYVGRGLAPLPDPHFVAHAHHAQHGIVHAQHVARAKVAPGHMKAASSMGPQQPVTTLTDTTLRRGDAVMTAGGIQVFRGARHYPFAAADFRPLASAGVVSHRGALLAIDRVLRTPAWSAAWTPSSPLVELPHLRRIAPVADTASRAMSQRS